MKPTDLILMIVFGAIWAAICLPTEPFWLYILVCFAGGAAIGSLIELLNR